VEAFRALLEKPSTYGDITDKYCFKNWINIDKSWLMVYLQAISIK